MPLPSFVIPGAQKSGTTTLHDVLGQHPAVWVSEPKELHFFDQHRDRGLEWYANQFTPGSQHAAWGESTPFYLYNDSVREDMARSLPDTRFIVILREPVARAYSHYWFSRSKGLEALPTFADAVDAEPARLAGRRGGQPAKFSYLDRGHYLRQLQSLEGLVGRARLLIHLLDDLHDDPQRVVQVTCEFLGLDPSPVSTLDPQVRNTFADRTWNSARKRAGAERAEGVPKDAYPPMDPVLRGELRQRFREENHALAAWLGRDLAHWM